VAWCKTCMQHFLNVCRRTYAEMGSKEVAVRHSQAKQGCTCCITSNGAGVLEPMQIIVKGKTHASLNKFITHNQAEWKKTGRGHTEHEEDGAVQLNLSSAPSYAHVDGHMLVAGNNTHWTNASTLQEWIRKVGLSTLLLICLIG
jgi:hypothetical protein